MADIRVIKRKKGHAGHHGGAWKVAYADFMTAMMAFFLVMWIVGLSQPTKEAIAGYFKDPTGFMKAVNEGRSPFSVGELKTGTSSKPSEQEMSATVEREKLKEAKKTIEKIVAATPEFKGLNKYVDIKLVNEGLRIDLLEAKESLFFDSGSAKIKPNTKDLLGRMARELAKLQNKVIIEGHTDSRPLARDDGYTNWELSADRANSARCIMESAGLGAHQVAQVRGYAATQPRDPKDPTHFSNRRVSIIVVMNHMLKRQQFSNDQDKTDPEVKSTVAPGITK